MNFRILKLGCGTTMTSPALRKKFPSEFLPWDDIFIGTESGPAWVGLDRWAQHGEHGFYFPMQKS